MTAHSSFCQKWQLPPDHMYSRWAKDVTPENVLPEYPRPQWVREDWLNLNGLWDYKIAAKDYEVTSDESYFDGKILVPFPVESAMSGVKKKVTAEEVILQVLILKL